MRVGGPEWSTPLEERAPTNIALLLPTQKLMHTLLTHTRSTPAGTYSRSLARSRNRQAAGDKQPSGQRAGQVNGAMIIMTLATMSCGGCERRRCAAAAI